MASLYQKLAKSYKCFHYESYHIEELDGILMLHFKYRIEGRDAEDIHFHHRIKYSRIGAAGYAGKDLSKFDNLIFHIGLVESINYYKTICPKEFKIHCGVLNKDQRVWWKKLFYNGLGEFLYLNNIHNLVSQDDFVVFMDDDSDIEIGTVVDIQSTGNLIPVGGGKDSVVTLEVLAEEKEDNLCFVMSPPQASYDCIEAAGYSEYLLAERFFDKRMLEMNDEGFMNGHVPFSAILGFISLLGAAIEKKKYIVLSNEKSADESTVHGLSINHQYSKSSEFEKDFSQYVQAYLVADTTYFSLLRRLFEIEIAERFARFNQYHDVFRSCNRGKKENIWCGKCAKCLFVYIILAPFMTLEEVDGIFGKNMFEDKSLQTIMEELAGFKKTKPFECVGTVDEIRWSLKTAIEKHYPDVKTKNLPPLLKDFAGKVKLESIASPIGGSDREKVPHNIPERFIKLYGDTV